MDGGDSLAIPGLEEDEVPVQWTSDGRSLYVYKIGELPARVSILGLDDGLRRPWRELAPSDPAGVFGVDSVAIAPDGEGYFYSYRRLLSTLYVIEGLK